MPVVVSVVAGLAIAAEQAVVGLATMGGFVLAGEYGTIAMMIGWSAISLGASFAFSEIGKALAPGPSLPTSITQAAAPRQTVYGQSRVAGRFAYLGTATSGRYLNMAITL